MVESEGLTKDACLVEKCLCLATRRPIRSPIASRTLPGMTIWLSRYSHRSL